MSEMVNNFVEHIQGLFSQLRELENIQFDKLQEICMATMDRNNKNEALDNLEDDIKTVLINKHKYTKLKKHN